MQVFKITDVKSFMNHMLCKETFDEFLISEATITTKASFVIDGHLVEDYYEPDELETMKNQGINCISYREVRNLCFEMIRGKKTPGYFKFVFLLQPTEIEKIISEYQIAIRTEDVLSLAMNIRFQNGELYITTGSSLRIFTPDKSLDNIWDQWISKFLSDNNISNEIFS